MQEQVSRIFGFYAVLHGGLLGNETVTTGRSDACEVRCLVLKSVHFVFPLPEPLLSAVATAWSLLLQCRQLVGLVVQSKRVFVGKREACIIHDGLKKCVFEELERSS